MTEVVLPLALAVIMVSLGLGLTVEDFRRVVVMPKGVAIGLINLVLISPLLAFGIAELFNLSAEMAVGLVLLGASPGGTMANMFTHLAKGDTALSVTMTAISSVASVITVPLFLGLADNNFGDGSLVGDVSMWGVVARVIAITLVPLSIGMWLNARYPERIAEIKPAISRVALVAFVLVVIGAVIVERDKVLDNFVDVAGAALTLNVAAMTISFLAARGARLSERQATAISLELGVHNATLAIAVAGLIDDELMIPAAVYSAFMFITGGIFARVMHVRNGRRAARLDGAEPAAATAD